MLTFWQMFLNFPEIKLVPASDIIFMGNPYYVKTALQHAIMLSVDNPFNYFMLGICLSSL